MAAPPAGPLPPKGALPLGEGPAPHPPGKSNQLITPEASLMSTGRSGVFPPFRSGGCEATPAVLGLEAPEGVRGQVLGAGGRPRMGRSTVPSLPHGRLGTTHSLSSLQTEERPPLWGQTCRLLVPGAVRPQDPRSMPNLLWTLLAHPPAGHELTWHQGLWVPNPLCPNPDWLQPRQGKKGVCWSDARTSHGHRGSELEGEGRLELLPL